ncbi:hypothetical protein Cch01nite_04190 [Cellulomonas chitinilytica]|uniref:Peptidase inhibitor family I36 n=1 Tax=Cellulomonas chitinilytica TaxID=398759 RepID=A0A919NZY7_9CELL|nr:peptidase inhibitor family I36 protein [Cellulomonas chitinilytica]GIG19695.1 hypothetical protein Cch01nite_04190 [Cellulomonas chitinilytica]
MRILRRAIVTLTVAGFGVLAVAPVAQAYDGLCDSGYMCLYTDAGYGGTLRGFSNSKLSFAGGAWLNDKTSSASANGGSCHRSYYINRDDWVLNDGYFYLNSRQLDNMNYRDPDLTNGAGVGSWAAPANANDQVSSAQFSDCR